MTTSTPPVVLVGVGEMGGVFAKALLKKGHTVIPVIRSTSVEDLAGSEPEPTLVLVTVGEDDLDGVLSSLPASWKNRVALIQNELLPRDWQRHGISDPTIAAVWFEKKPGIDTNVLIPTPIGGPHADLLVDALSGSGIDATAVTPDQMVEELIAKNLYILVANIAGLQTGGTVSQLWSEHEDLARAVGDEVLEIQEYLVGRAVERDEAYERMLVAFAGDPDHGTTGRSAPRRLARALGHARDAGVEVPTLTAIARTHNIAAD
jgi:ketopantoate reductase